MRLINSCSAALEFSGKRPAISRHLAEKGAEPVLGPRNHCGKGSAAGTRTSLRHRRRVGSSSGRRRRNTAGVTNAARDSGSTAAAGFKLYRQATENEAWRGAGRGRRRRWRRRRWTRDRRRRRRGRRERRGRRRRSLRRSRSGRFGRDRRGVVCPGKNRGQEPVLPGAGYGAGYHPWYTKPGRAFSIYVGASEGAHWKGLSSRYVSHDQLPPCCGETRLIASAHTCSFATSLSINTQASSTRFAITGSVKRIFRGSKAPTRPWIWLLAPARTGCISWASASTWPGERAPICCWSSLRVGRLS